MNCKDIDCEEMNIKISDPTSSNFKILTSHLDKTQCEELELLILENKHLFPDIPTRINKIYHGVDVEGSKSMKQHPYRMNPMELQYLRKETQ